MHVGTCTCAHTGYGLGSHRRSPPRQRRPRCRFGASCCLPQPPPPLPHEWHCMACVCGAGWQHGRRMYVTCDDVSDDVMQRGSIDVISYHIICRVSICVYLCLSLSGCRRSSVCASSRRRGCRRATPSLCPPPSGPWAPTPPPPPSIVSHAHVPTHTPSPCTPACTCTRHFIVPCASGQRR
jgi:hypothetical protein